MKNNDSSTQLTINRAPSEEDIFVPYSTPQVLNHTTHRPSIDSTAPDSFCAGWMNTIGNLWSHYCCCDTTE